MFFRKDDGVGWQAHAREKVESFVCALRYRLSARLRRRQVVRGVVVARATAARRRRVRRPVVPVERMIMMPVIVSLRRRLGSVMLVYRRHRPPAAPRRRRPLMVSRDVRAADATAAAQRVCRGRLSGAAADGRDRWANGDAHHLIVTRLHFAGIVAASAAALHRHGTRPTPAAPQQIPVAGRGHRVQPHAIRVGLLTKKNNLKKKTEYRPAVRICKNAGP